MKRYQKREIRFFFGVLSMLYKYIYMQGVQLLFAVHQEVCSLGVIHRRAIIIELLVLFKVYIYPNIICKS